VALQRVRRQRGVKGESGVAGGAGGIGHRGRGRGGPFDVVCPRLGPRRAQKNLGPLGGRPYVAGLGVDQLAPSKDHELGHFVDVTKIAVRGSAEPTTRAQRLLGGGRSGLQTGQESVDETGTGGVHKQRSAEADQKRGAEAEEKSQPSPNFQAGPPASARTLSR